MKNLSTRPAFHSRGSALLVVLALLLLLTTLTVAFLSRATFERQLSNASFSQGKVDLAGQGAITAIIGDLQQEIVAGSLTTTSTPVSPVAAGYCYPTSPLTAVPCPVVPVNSFNYTPSSIVGSGMENLLKISQRGTTFWSGANYPSGTTYYTPSTGPQRAASGAAAVATTTASLNGRSVTPVRWNAPLLMSPALTTSTDFTPPSAFVNNPPDWIYVAPDGSNPGNDGTTWNSSWSIAGTNPVTQRYAYAIYDEGSTLDLNTAGSPILASTGVLGAAGGYSNNQPYKNALAYADLKQLPGISGLSGTNQQAFINAIVGWRNFASADEASGNVFPNGYSFTSSANGQAWYFDQNVIFNPGGYLTANAPAVAATSPIYGPQSGPNRQNAKNQTDNAFASRQQLLQFFLLNLGQNTTFTGAGKVTLATLTSVLPYLGTFSRDISQPSYAPDPNRPVVLNETSGGNDMAGQLGTGSSYSYTTSTATTAQNTINPAFLSLTAPATSFTRNDGTASIPGEPLVKKRFALMRLAWLTYRGPSADRTWPLSATAGNVGDQDHDLYLLINSYGVPASFLQQGTDANIAKYFGLAWLGPNAKNLYSGSAAGQSDSGLTVGIGDGTQKWKYVHGSNVSGSGLVAAATTSPGPINTLTQVQGDLREPDFFELLKAAVTVGAIAKPAAAAGNYLNNYPTAAQPPTPDGYSNEKDSSVDAYIIQLGANIIAQSNPSNYCPRIIFDDGVTFKNSTTDYPQEYRGLEDLPYLYRTRCVFIKTAGSTPGGAPAHPEETNAGTAQAGGVNPPTSDPGGQGYVLEVPEIWNPHTWNPNATVSSGISPMGNVDSSATGQPEFKIYMLSTDPNNTLPLASQPTKLAFFARPAVGAGYDDGAIGAFNFNKVGANDYRPWIGFDIPSTGLGFFREPTLLNKPDYSNPLLNTSLLKPSLLLPTAAPGYGPPVGSDVVGSIIGYTYQVGPPVYKQTYIGYIKSLYQSAAYTTGANDNQYYLGFSLAPPNQPTLTSLWIHATHTFGSPTAYNAGYYQIGGLGEFNGDPTLAQYSGNFNFTYRLQYKDPISGTYVTYDEKFLPLAWPSAGDDGFPNPFLGASSLPAKPWVSTYSNDPVASYAYAGTADPRANRWASQEAMYSLRSYVSGASYSGTILPPPLVQSSGTAFAWNGWVGSSVNAVMSEAPDYNLGWPATSPTASLGFYSLQNPPSNSTGGKYVTAGSLELNITSADANDHQYVGSFTLPSGANQYYADADGVVRRGTAGYLTSSSGSGPTTQPLGMPFATSTTFTVTGTPPNPATTTTPTNSNNGNRPVMLHRPFRTVAELGYVFSGTPGKNIDFSTPESGYSALLDVFCINDTNDPNNLVAGKVNINTRQAAVLEAILGAAYKDELASYFYGSPIPAADLMSSTEASALITDSSNGLIQRTTNLTTASLGPLRNISELVGKYVYTPSNANYTSSLISGTSPPAYQPYNATTAASSLYSGFSGDMNGVTPASIMAGGTTPGTTPRMDVVQRFHEAAIRALAANTTSRVWNLMIDVIAQTGRFPSSATGLANFNVEGERRYWVHVAIDRYTGKVLDEQVEEVKE